MHTIRFQVIPLAMLLLASCGRREETKQDAAGLIPVITEQVQPKRSASRLSVSGNVEGNKTVRLGFMVAGRIESTPLEAGQSVLQGQLLAALDTASYSIAKQIADVQVLQVNDEYERLKLMHDRNSISESDFRKADFGLQQAKNQQKLQKQNMIYTRIYSPISGIVIRKLAERGEIVAVGTPVLVVSDISSVKVNAYIPEQDLWHVKLGQQARVYINALDSSFTGKVAEVGSAADPGSRAFTVKIDIPNPGLLIRPGMVAEISLASDQLRNSIAVPVEAVLREADGKNYLYVLDRQSKKAFRRPVSLGELSDNAIEVISGLSAGETIVTGGQHKLTDGASVSFTN